MSRNLYAAAPLSLTNLAEWCLRLAQVINNVLNGKTNNLGSVTLDVAPATTTTISNTRITGDTAIFLCPKTATAAGAVGGLYASAAPGAITLTHAASAATDRTFDFVLIG